nr:type II toxin-antitoxin system death-on-curing family toxin [Altericroceibacterium indicum]
MVNEPRWLSVDDLITFNRLAVQQTGEPFSIRDQKLLESAWAKPQNHKTTKPQNHWHYGEQDIVLLAVQLLLDIARDHPFEQGNKRTAFAAADAFLYLNGYEMHAPDGTPLADLIVQAITGDVDEAMLISAVAWSTKAI